MWLHTFVTMFWTSGCIPYKPNAGGTPVASQVCAKVKVGVHLRCKDQKNRARIFVFYCARTLKIIV